MFHLSATVDDAALSRLHHRAFGSASTAVVPWSERLSRYSLFWVSATEAEDIVGFVNVIGDGGAHAVVLDTVVSPEMQGRGIGKQLIEIAATEARARGCHWLHVDFEPRLAGFYVDVCGFRATTSGLRRLI